MRNPIQRKYARKQTEQVASLLASSEDYRAQVAEALIQIAEADFYGDFSAVLAEEESLPDDERRASLAIAACCRAAQLERSTGR